MRASRAPPPPPDRQTAWSVSPVSPRRWLQSVSCGQDNGLRQVQAGAGVYKNERAAEREATGGRSGVQTKTKNLQMHNGEWRRCKTACSTWNRKNKLRTATTTHLQEVLGERRDHISLSADDGATPKVQPQNSWIRIAAEQQTRQRTNTRLCGCCVCCVCCSSLFLPHSHCWVLLLLLFAPLHCTKSGRGLGATDS